VTTLVVGATGLLGRQICDRLRKKGLPTRAMVRPGSPIEPWLAERGVECVRGDLKDADSLSKACQGASAVITTANSMISRRRGDNLKTVDRDGNLALLDAACRAGVPRFVYVSLSPNGPPACAFIRYKRLVEDAVRQSGLRWTILQPSAFMETSFTMRPFFDVSRGIVRTFGSGEARTSFVSLDDVAQFAVASLERPELENRDLPLGGPEALSVRAVAGIFSQAFGREFRLRRIPLWIPKLVGALAAPFSDRLASIGAFCVLSSAGDVIDMSDLVAETGIPLTSVADFARRAAASTASHGSPT
jgi:NADH dehydrogenase